MDPIEARAIHWAITAIITGEALAIAAALAVVVIR
jgi:hypothetical protein